jgi:hypothetical protein
MVAGSAQQLSASMCFDKLMHRPAAEKIALLLSLLLC